MHRYCRQLLSEKREKEAMEVFQKNYKKCRGGWPANSGLMRGYSAKGDLKKALAYAGVALTLASNGESKRLIEQAVKTLESGKPL
jgi:hypothetical protein